MATVQRLYKVATYPPSGANHTATVWTDLLGGVYGVAWISADATAYVWPSGGGATQLHLNAPAETTDAKRTLGALDGGQFYGLFAHLVEISPAFQDPT